MLLTLGRELHPNWQGCWASLWRLLPNQGLTLSAAPSPGLSKVERQRPSHLALPGVTGRQHLPHTPAPCRLVAFLSGLSHNLMASCPIPLPPPFLPRELISKKHFVPRAPSQHLVPENSCHDSKSMTLINIALRCWLVCPCAYKLIHSGWLLIFLKIISLGRSDITLWASSFICLYSVFPSLLYSGQSPPCPLHPIPPHSSLLWGSASCCSLYCKCSSVHSFAHPNPTHSWRF